MRNVIRRAVFAASVAASAWKVEPHWRVVMRMIEDEDRKRVRPTSVPSVASTPPWSRPLWQTEGVPQIKGPSPWVKPSDAFDVVGPQPERTAEALWTGDDWAYASGRAA